MGFRFMRPQIWREFDQIGWYARLSAPGYLDCTETLGPFTTSQDAARELVRMYGPEDDGRWSPDDDVDDDALAWFEWAKDEGVADEFGDELVESFEAAIARRDE